MTFQQSSADKGRASIRYSKDISSSFSTIDDIKEAQPRLLPVKSLPFNFAQIPIHAPSISLQKKLTINEPGDEYEQEADAMADKVMRMTDSDISQTKLSSSNNIHPKCASCGKEEGGNYRAYVQQVPAQIRCAKCEEVEKLQKKEFDSMKPQVSNTVLQTLQSSGQPLDKPTRSFIEDRFGFDFSKIRIHDNSFAHQSAKNINALAYTQGINIVFGEGQYQTNTTSGRKLLAHELTHVVQQMPVPAISNNITKYKPASWQNLIRRKPAPPNYNRVTGVIDKSRIEIDSFPDFFVDGIASPVTIKADVKDSLITHLTWELYDPNDKMMSGSFSTIPGKSKSITQPFTLRNENFPANNFIDGKYTLLCSGLNNNHEPIVYAEREFLVYHSSFSLGTTRGLAKDKSRPKISDIPPSPVNTFSFKGTSQERALIIGGVHGSEQSGVQVVEELKKLLSNPKLPLPYFNTILIPSLFPDNLAYDKAYRALHIYEQGQDLAPQSGGRYTRLGNKPEDLREPNRNYPMPGTSLETALDEDKKVGGRDTTVPPPSGTKKVKQPLLPETKMLLSLIQTLRPNRIASVHGHRPSKKVGDAPGIFVDPRVGDPAIAAQDDALARRMLKLAKTKGLTGSNPKDDIHYAASHPIGASLGDWAPKAVDEGTPGIIDRPGDRPGITTITVEVEGYSPKEEDVLMDSRIKIHSETLLEAFLARP